MNGELLLRFESQNAVLKVIRHTLNGTFKTVNFPQKRFTFCITALIQVFTPTLRMDFELEQAEALAFYKKKQRYLE